MTGRTRQRLVRPVERQSMRDWLSDKLNAKEIPGLEWVNRDHKIFRIKWCHGSRHGWSLKDSILFEKWALHSGRYNDGDPKRWKANFRCALNSLKDVEEVKDMSVSKGQNAFRVYRMLDSRKKTEKVRVTKRRKSEPDKDYVPKQNENVHNDVTVNLRASTRLAAQTVTLKTEIEEPREPSGDETDSEGYQTDVQEDKCMDWIAEEHVTFPPGPALTDIKQEETYSSSQIPKFDKIIPDFYKVEFGKNHWLPRHGSGFKVEQLKQQTPPSPILQAFHVQLPDSIVAQLKTSVANLNSVQTPPLKMESPSVTTMKFLPTTMQTISFTSSTPQITQNLTPACSAQTNVSHSFTIPTTNQLVDRDNCNYMTFPETPDGSEVSHDSNSGEFIELTIYEEEVTDTPAESTDGCIVLTDLSRSCVPSMALASEMNTVQRNKGLHQHGTGRFENYSYNPLTPP